MSAAAAGKQKLVKRQLFPEKLWELVNKPASGIRWSPDGKRIEVERGQLEKFNGTKFRSRNFDSFIRQLHFYGFRKTGNSYHHDKFQRAQPEALLTMKRKYSNQTPLAPSRNVNVKSSSYTISSNSNISQLSTICNSNNNSSSCNSTMESSSSAGSKTQVATDLSLSNQNVTGGGAIDLSGSVKDKRTSSSEPTHQTIPSALNNTSCTKNTSNLNLKSTIGYSSTAKLKHIPSFFKNPSKSIRLSSNKLFLYIEE